MIKNKFIKNIIIILIVIAFWQLVSSLNILPSFFLPSPKKVFDEGIKMIISGEIFYHILQSLKRVLIGFLISCVIGFVFGSLSSIKNDEKSDNILINLFRHIPPMSLIPLLILWCGIGETSKIIIIVLTAFSPIYVNVKEGLKIYDIKTYEMAKTLGMNDFDRFINIKIPYAIPHILDGMKIALGYSFRAIVGAEMIAATSGIGFMILDAKASFRIDKMLVGVIMIGIVGILIEYLFNKFAKIEFKKYYFQ